MHKVLPMSLVMYVRPCVCMSVEAKGECWGVFLYHSVLFCDTSWPLLLNWLGSKPHECHLSPPPPQH